MQQIGVIFVSYGQQSYIAIDCMVFWHLRQAQTPVRPTKGPKGLEYILHVDSMI